MEVHTGHAAAELREGGPCRSCGAKPTVVFHEQPRVPVACCQLLSSRDQALRVPAGRIALAFCEACGFVQNDAFDPSCVDYAASYEDSQAFSSRFREFAERLARRLVESYDVRGKDVLEIGCGKGDFLSLVCDVGGNRGIGIDPACEPDRQASSASGRLRFIRDFYSPRYADLPGDLVCCRHTLEHLPDVSGFVTMVRDLLPRGGETRVFFEVPDATRVLDELAFWDVYYEHCSYFTPGSLARLFRASGFEVLRLERDFGEQYLLLDARLAHGAPAAPQPLDESPETLRPRALRFGREVARIVDDWRKRLDRRQGKGKAVLWGGGSKAVGFLTALGADAPIECVVDINPYKQGMYLPGTGHEIVAPAQLEKLRPDLVLVANPVYVGEIRELLADLGLHPALETF